MPDLARCISTPPGARVFLIRTEFITALEHFNAQNPDRKIGDGYMTCAAALLSVLEYKTNLDIEQRKRQIEYARAIPKAQRPKIMVHTWSKVSMAAWKRETLGLFSDRKISAALLALEIAGLIVRRSNPWNSWDKSPQYKLKIAALERLVTGAAKPGKIFASKMQSRSPQNAESMLQGAVIDGAEEPNRSGNLSADSVPSLEPSLQASSNQPSSESKAADDDETLRGFFGDYIKRFGPMPESLTPSLLKSARRLGRDATVKKLESLRPSKNAWKYADTALEKEPTPLFGGSPPSSAPPPSEQVDDSRVPEWFVPSQSPSSRLIQWEQELRGFGLVQGQTLIAALDWAYANIEAAIDEIRKTFCKEVEMS